jgi:hypothetical protein
VAANPPSQEAASTTAPQRRTPVLILGAAGRDFHTFNVCFRDDPDYEVIAFTAAQIPGIENRRYPAPWLVGFIPMAFRSLPKKRWKGSSATITSPRRFSPTAIFPT